MAKGVIFDLDGTLVDSAPDLHAIANMVLKSHGQKELDIETVTSFIGNGVPKLVERCFKAVGAPLKGEALEMAIEQFLEKYATQPVRLSKFFPKVEETLQILKDKGYVLGVCSNKTERLSRMIAEQMGLMKYLTFVAGGDRLPQKKPAPEPLINCAHEMGCDISEIIYVGDSETDAATAEAAGVPFILYTEGYRKVLANELYHQGLYCKFSHLPHLVRLIANQD